MNEKLLAYFLIIASIFLSTIGCSNGSGGNSGGTNSQVVVGTLSNDSAVISSPASYTIKQGATATGNIYLSGGINGSSYSVYFIANNSGISVSQALINTQTSAIINGNKCILTNQSNLSCQITISVANNVPNNTYTLTPYFTNISSGALTIVNPILVKVSGGIATLIINPEVVTQGDTTIATISLNGYYNNNSVDFTISSNSSNIASVNNSSCTITNPSISPSNCSISLTAISSGSTVITATNPVYGTLKANITVSPLITNTWLSGANTINQLGSYATITYPGAREGSIMWLTNGNLWLFGGLGYDTQSIGYLNDLWQYNINTKVWTWVGGSNLIDQLGTYGTQGSAASTNIPGGRTGSASWLDNNGNLWLFGGQGNSQANIWFFNDLWQYNPLTNQWTWISGSDLSNQRGIYDQNLNNVPGSRYQADSWLDNNGNLWLFGGDGYDSNGNFGSLNDLWQYNINTQVWTWVKGSNIASTLGVYGSKGVANILNTPGGRSKAVTWVDSNGGFWLFGGLGYNGTDPNSLGALNDLWYFNPNNNMWTWMSGESTLNNLGFYGTQGLTTSTNMPGARSSAISWLDNNGNFWLLGGLGYDAESTFGNLNDLWYFNPNNNMWTWMSGDKLSSQLGSYGTKGVSSRYNIIGARNNSVASGSTNDFYLFGGYGYSSTATSGLLNDLWLISIQQ